MFRGIYCYCLVFVLLNTNFITSHSQSNHFIAGVFVNANGMHITGDDQILWQSSGGRIWGGGGLSAGIAVMRNLNRDIYAGFELRFIQKGSIYEYFNQYVVQTYEVFRLHYIEIPFFIGYRFRINKKDYMIETGIAPARLFSSKLKIDELAGRNVLPDIGNFKSSDVSWTGSFKFPLNRKHKQNLIFGLRFSHSILSIHKNYNLRNMVFGLELEYLFNHP